MGHTREVWLSWAASAARLGMGVKVVGRTKQPERLLQLYEFEGCPYCRKVRDALTALDLDAMIYPCPKGGETFRARVKELGGKLQFPFLVDPNTGRQMYESDDIVRYLFATYGEGAKPGVAFGKPMDASSFLASAFRLGKGTYKVAARMPAKPLELWGFEESPFSRIARETLCELEIPYVLHNVGKGANIDWLLPKLRKRFAPDAPMTTENRRRFVARSGMMQVPFLVDPNTGVEMFESAAIRKYLLDTYALGRAVDV